MLKFLIYLASATGLVLVLIIAARFGDGPTGPLPGGSLSSGQRLTHQEFKPPIVQDGRWELEINGTSRLVAMFLVNEELIAMRPSIATPYGWSQAALSPHEASVRIDGKLFQVVLQPIQFDDPRLDEIRAVFTQNLAVSSVGSDPDTWFFEISARK